MALLLSLGRETKEVELGAHEELTLTEDKICAPGGGRVFAQHSDRRWHSPHDNEEYSRVDIVGPLLLQGSDAEGRSKVLGPYAHFSFIDGVAYVDRRVFGFWDLDHRNWYLVDLGAHWKDLTIRFHRPGK